jgi:hypothetical protein
MKIRKLVLALALLTAATTLVAQTTVFVPGNASGYFGNWNDQAVPFVSAITISGPSTITVTYVSGTVQWNGGEVGPNGGPYPASTFQFPLQEAKGVAPHTKLNNIAALIGAFVPQSRAQLSGFSALDGTKNITKVGIMPSSLFFVGESKSITVKLAGTLFLGINDTLVSDNSGGFTVQVTSSAAGK